MKNILIVVDMQNGFARYEQTKQVGKKIVELLNTGSFDYTIATQFINPERGLYRKVLHWEKLTKSPETDLIDGISVDKVLKKNIYTPVNQELINTMIEVNGGEKPNYVFIVGVDTDCCVMKTAVDLFEQDIIPIVLLEYCNSNGGEMANKAGIRVLERLIGKKQLVKGKITSALDLQDILLQLGE